jgi:hypothetical protein
VMLGTKAVSGGIDGIGCKRTPCNDVGGTSDDYEIRLQRSFLLRSATGLRPGQTPKLGPQ